MDDQLRKLELNRQNWKWAERKPYNSRFELHELEHDRKIWKWTGHKRFGIVNPCITKFIVPQGAVERCTKNRLHGTYCETNVAFIEKSICSAFNFWFYQPESTSRTIYDEHEYKEGTMMNDKKHDIWYYPNQDLNSFKLFSPNKMKTLIDYAKNQKFL